MILSECVSVSVRECCEITFSVSAVLASFLSRQIVLLRELLLGWQSQISLLYSSFLSHPTRLLSVILAPNISRVVRLPQAREANLALFALTSPELVSPALVLLKLSTPGRESYVMYIIPEKEDLWEGSHGEHIQG